MPFTQKDADAVAASCKRIHTVGKPPNMVGLLIPKGKRLKKYLRDFGNLKPFQSGK